MQAFASQAGLDSPAARRKVGNLKQMKEAVIQYYKNCCHEG